MYSAATSSPRDGVLRPSSRSDAMNERCPRSEFAEMCRTTARSASESGAGGVAAGSVRSNTSRTGAFACPLIHDQLMRQISVRLLRADLFVGVLHLRR